MKQIKVVIELGVIHGTALTTARTIYDVGTTEFEGRQHFATYGDPAFEAVLRQVETFPQPAWIPGWRSRFPVRWRRWSETPWLSSTAMAAQAATW
jgi:hypothetical protein